jgi:8-oxo-dGTP pyrophosphatase MutT (NUDIX family)
MATRHQLIRSLTAYKSPYPEENKFREQFLTLLEHPRAFFRDHLPGHITGSAWIIASEDKMLTLLTHHAKLNRWLQPGGHADGDENIRSVAFREAMEETGLKTLKPVEEIFDIDIHPIPARGDMPQHFHYDIRFLFHASANEAFTITEESHALAWKNVRELPVLTGNNRSILRMAEKVEKLF